MKTLFDDLEEPCFTEAGGSITWNLFGVAQLLDIPVEMVEQAVDIRDEGDSLLSQLVMDGRLDLADAHRLLDVPKGIQRQFANHAARMPSETKLLAGAYHLVWKDLAHRMVSSNKRTRQAAWKECFGKGFRGIPSVVPHFDDPDLGFLRCRFVGA